MSGCQVAYILCRGVYHGQDTSAGIQYENGDFMTAGGRRSKRPRTTTDASNPLAAPVTPLHCSQPDGSTALLHHCDIVFMTYESLRKELSFQNRRAPGSRSAASVLHLLQPSGTPHGAACTLHNIKRSACAMRLFMGISPLRHVPGRTPGTRRLNS